MGLSVLHGHNGVLTPLAFYRAVDIHQFYTQLQGIQNSLNQRFPQTLLAEQVTGFVLIFNNLHRGYASLCA